VPGVAEGCVFGGAVQVCGCVMWVGGWGIRCVCRYIFMCICCLLITIFAIGSLHLSEQNLTEGEACPLCHFCGTV